MIDEETMQLFDKIASKGKDLHAAVERCKEAIRKIDERELLRETLRFLEALPEDLGRGSLNGQRAQLMHAIRQLGDE